VLASETNTVELGRAPRAAGGSRCARNLRRTANQYHWAHPRAAPVDRQRRASLQKATRLAEMGTITDRGQRSGSLQRFRNSPIGSSGACGK